MLAAREWSVRNARALERIYDAVSALMVRSAPLLRAIGYERLERPVAALERVTKGFLFDCRMCGTCVLRSTGMSCPMNCPKRLRNGPCGGVRADGHCEVDPSMRCVWVAAWDGAGRMRNGGAIHEVQIPVAHAREGRSSWLHHVRAESAARAQQAG